MKTEEVLRRFICKIEKEFCQNAIKIRCQFLDEFPRMITFGVIHPLWNDYLIYHLIEKSPQWLTEGLPAVEKAMTEDLNKINKTITDNYS